MVRCLVGVVGGAALLLGGLVAAAAPAGAQTVTPLAPAVSLGSDAVYSSMAVDPVDQEIFVSLPSAGVVDVLDFSGHLVTTITGLAAMGTQGQTTTSSSADSIVYDDDNGEVYVTDTDAGTVDEIDPDPSSLSIVKTVATGLLAPDDLVESAGLLWTASDSTTLVSIDPTTGVVTPHEGLLEGPGIVASDAIPDTIFSYDESDSPLNINRIDVSSTPTVVTSSRDNDIDNVNDISITPDGQSLIPAGGSPYQFDELSSTTLAPDGTIYPAEPYPTAAATTATNGGLFAGGLDGLYGPDLYVYRLGDPSDLLLEDAFPPPSGDVNLTVPDRGVAFSPDGTELFVMEDQPLGGTASFGVFSIDQTGSSPTTTAVTSSTDASTYGNPVTLTATANASEGTGVIEFSAGGSPVDGCSDVGLVAGASGFFDATCTTSSLPGGNDSIQASFSGDSNDAPSSGTLPGGVTVAPAPLIVAAQNVRRGYGATPPLGVLFSGFVLGQSLATSDVSGSAACTSAPAKSKPGRYPITCLGGTLASHDYSFAAFVPGTLTVTRAATELVVASAKAKGSHPTVAALLVNQASGRFVRGQIVRFSAGSTLICTAKTNAAGLATCRSSRSLAGENSYGAAFAKTADYLPASGIGPVIP